jgi:hypothetical protein
MRTLIHLLLALMLAALFPVALAQSISGRTEVLWLGQSAFRIATPEKYIHAFGDTGKRALKPGEKASF